MSQIQRALRACADTKVTPLTPHWADDARRLMRQAADALDAAEEVMAEHRSQSPAEGDENSIAMAWNTIRAEARKLSGCHFGLSDLLTAVEQYGDRRAAQAKVQPKGTEPPGWVCPELTPESMTDLAVAIGELSQAMGSPCVMGRAPQTIKSQTVRLAAFRLKEAQAPAPADDQWRDAVDQQLILCELTVTNFATPSDAVRGLLDWHAMVAREVCSASPAPAPEHVPVSPEHEAAPAHQDYVLSLLVAAGHVTQAKVDEAREIAAKVAPAPSPAVGAEVAALLPGTYYMDPPDGGNATVLEQLQRMAKDAARYRWVRDNATVGTVHLQTSDGWAHYGSGADDVVDAAMDAFNVPVQGSAE